MIAGQAAFSSLTESRMKSRKPTFAEGNQVYVKTASGHDDTLYVITKLMPPFGCMIREHGTDYAEQRFDTSLLVHAVTDEMLKAFSFGSIKAKR
jgi:hypothetical protein